MLCKENHWLWCPSYIKYLQWLSLLMLWASWIRKMECPSSQLYRCHTTFQTTATWVWNSLLWCLPQKLHFSSRFSFASRMCTFMSPTFCLSYLSFYLYYLFLFMNAHYWISWRSRNSNFFSLIRISETVLLFYNLMRQFLYCHEIVISESK